MSELLDRLCKVRRLARQSPEPGERKNAEEKLTQLLEKHKLSEADLNHHDYQGTAPPAPPPQPQWGGVVVQVMPGHGFGSVFGFGFGFNVHFTDGSVTSTTGSTGV